MIYAVAALGVSVDDDPAPSDDEDDPAPSGDEDGEVPGDEDDAAAGEAAGLADDEPRLSVL